jgi:hypothetical protein
MASQHASMLPDTAHHDLALMMFGTLLRTMRIARWHAHSSLHPWVVGRPYQANGQDCEGILPFDELGRAALPAKCRVQGALTLE